ncbi:hypothetical protein [Luteolibacter soli]|uniref:Uncharacterized protein n=1 Tax=Luteolibacter soli TaxID=3135280 RepID=A0ABU9AVN4_9BACT
MNQSLYERSARVGCFSLLSLGCLVMFALCSSPSEYVPLKRNPDGSPVVDAAGDYVTDVSWRSELVNAMPLILTVSVSAFFLILAVRAAVRNLPR